VKRGILVVRLIQYLVRKKRCDSCEYFYLKLSSQILRELVLFFSRGIQKIFEGNYAEDFFVQKVEALICPLCLWCFRFAYVVKRHSNQWNISFTCQWQIRESFSSVFFENILPLCQHASFFMFKAESFLGKFCWLRWNSLVRQNTPITMPATIEIYFEISQDLSSPLERITLPGTLIYKKW
jgi:hypothetical protein